MEDFFIIGLALLSLGICLFNVLNPRVSMDWYVKWTKFTLEKMAGFEVEIKSTRRAEKIFKIYSIFMFIGILLATVGIVVAYPYH